MKKINLILLASGYSRRFKGNKLLADLNNKPIFMHIIDKVIDMKFNKIICVTQYEEIEKILAGTCIDVIINENSSLGISNSIKLGIGFDKDADAYMFMVCDQPFMKRETIQRIIDKFVSGDKGIVAAGNKDIPGNPVIFSKKYLYKLLSLQGDTGGKKIVNMNLEDTDIIQVYESELVDIDTRDVYENLI